MAIELANVMKEEDRMYNWVNKVVYKPNEMSDEDKEISQAVDEWAKEMGNYGESSENNKSIANFITKVIEPEIHNYDESLILQRLFDEQDIGEFDDVDLMYAPKNTLVAYDSSKAANVDKSYIDFSRGTTFKNHLQVETEIRYADLRRNGYRSIARISNYAVEALSNKRFVTVFDAITNMLTGLSDQSFSATGSVDIGAMENAAGYVFDRGDTPILIGLSTQMRKISTMDGYQAYLSDDMKNALNMKSSLGKFEGVDLVSVNASSKTGDGHTLLPTNRIFGIADKIGGFSMIGDMRTYITADNNYEKFNLKFTGYEFMFNIIKPDKICQIIIS